MGRNFFSFAIIVCSVIVFITSCKHELPINNTNNPGVGGGSGGGGGSTQTCDPNTVYFNQQVLPILISNCSMSGCHDVSSHQDGVVLTSYSSVMSTADVRPYYPTSSKIYRVLNETDPSKRMPRPPQNPLTQQQKDLIFKWIQQGAKDLYCQNSCDSNSFTYSGAIKQIIADKCQGCHSGSSPAYNIDLSTYNGVKAKVNDGKLWGSINQLAGYFPMPKNGNKLSDCEIAQFRKWIAAGAPNN
jgi:uncharacterized membrane protein